MKLRPLIIAFSAYLALIAAHTIWGSNFVIAKLALREFPIMSLAFLRFFLASILLIPFAVATSGSKKINLKDLQRIVLSSILMITIHIALFYEGLSRTTAINASVLSLIAPIFSVLVGWRILKEKIYTVNLFGTTLALFGSLTVLGLPFLLTGVLSQTHITGDVLIILSSLERPTLN